MSYTEERLQKRREYAKQYRENHRDIERERVQKFKEKNPEKQAEYRRRWREKHKDEIREKQRLEYDKKLAEQGKTRRVPLTDEEKEAKRLTDKEKARSKAKERYLANFVSVEKVCKYCGKPFMTQYKKSKTFCSDECAHKHAHYMAKLAEKRRKGKITALDNYDSDITLPLLFNRDKGICQICGMPCDWSDIEVKDNFAIVGTDYPSIDHITPISKGGTHTWDNVQLVHHYCNSLKSDRETGGSLF